MSIQQGNKPYLRSKYSNALTRQACVSCPSACSCDLGERSVMDQLMIKKWQQGGVNTREGFDTDVSESLSPNLLTLCGRGRACDGTSGALPGVGGETCDGCFTWDIYDPNDGFKVNKCYTLDDTIGNNKLSDKLKGVPSDPLLGGVCSFYGMARLPDGYKLETNNLSGSWVEGEASCGPRHDDHITLESPNCPPSGDYGLLSLYQSLRK